MRKIINIIRWVGVAYFAIMMFFAISQGGFLGALLFFIGGAIIAPLNVVSKIRSKLKLNKVLSIIISVVLMYAGIFFIPVEDILVDTDTEASKTVSENASSTTDLSENTSENTSEDTTEIEIPTTITDDTESTTEEVIAEKVDTPINQTVPTTEKTETPTKKPVTTTEREETPTKKPQTGRTIYITPTGKRYHYDSSCGNGTYNSSTLDYALSLGLTPCKKCAGG